MRHTMQRTRRWHRIAYLLTLGLLVPVVTSCGGGSGGPASGQGLVLMDFSLDSVDNAALNSRLRWDFSGPVDPGSITDASVQIREGGDFGLTVPGSFSVSGSTVYFEPALPSSCDLSDAGLVPGMDFSVQLLGAPEEFSVRNQAGQPLSSTQTYHFSTRVDTDPDRFTDQIPNAAPMVVSTSPADGDMAVAVAPGNRIVLTLSENVDPCSVTSDSVSVYMYESGDPGVMTPVPGSSPVRYSGFDKGGDVADQTPGDPYTWGADGTTSYAGAPRRILCNLDLQQDFDTTRIVVTPLLGYNPDPAKNASLFPEDALIVVRLSFDIHDFGGQALSPVAMAFTTENLAQQSDSYLIENEGETPYVEALTTAAVDPDERAKSRVQGYLLFAGDGDNGADPLVPSHPETPGSGCTTDRQANDGTTDDFSPTADVVFDTGATPNTCPNLVDGSYGVVWEFSTFTVASGVTVSFVGVNPAILLVKGDVRIEAGGRVLLKGGNGQSGKGYPSAPNQSNGGTAVAGGGRGGNAWKAGTTALGEHGYVGYGSPDYTGLPVAGGEGAGHGNAAVTGTSTYYGIAVSSASGGGGGHATAGQDGEEHKISNSSWKTQTDGMGGAAYPTGPNTDRMLLPSAGSGGGAAGWSTSYNSTSTYYLHSGGAGGAGGGFLDITSSGNIYVYGLIDASGGNGGNGHIYYVYYTYTGGGGGGSGGGVRLLTPLDIDVSGGTIDVSGGAGGVCATSSYNPSGLPNTGGNGANGRIVLEDGDGIIKGQGSASLVPGEGSTGFYRGQFDATRFQGGGLEPKAVTDLIPLGNYSGLDPVFQEPVQNYGGQTDFIAGIPGVGSPGSGSTALMVEVRGYQMKPDGTADMASATDWVTVGYFRDSGVVGQPTWHGGHPADIPVPADNAGGPGGFAQLNGIGGGGFEFLQVRFTIFLPATVGPFDPGSYLDNWLIRFQHDQ